MWRAEVIRMRRAPLRTGRHQALAPE